MQAPAMDPLALQPEHPQEPVQAQPEMHPPVLAQELIGQAAMAPLQEEHPEEQDLQAQEEPPFENEPPINQQEPDPVPAQASAQQRGEDDSAFHEQADLELPHYVESPSDRSQLYPSQGPEAGPPLGSLQADWVDPNGQSLPDIDHAYARSYLNGDAYALQDWENPDQYDPWREIEDSGSGGYRNDEALFSRDLDSDDRVSQGDADEVRSRSIDSVPAQQATEPEGLQDAEIQARIREGMVADYYDYLDRADLNQADMPVMKRQLSGDFYNILLSYLEPRQNLIEQYTGTTKERSQWRGLEKNMGRIRTRLEGDLSEFQEIAFLQRADNERMGAYMQENEPEKWEEWQTIVDWAENIAGDLQTLLDASQQDLPDAAQIQALRQEKLEKAMEPLASLATLATEIEGLSRGSIEELAKAQKELITNYIDAETEVIRKDKEAQITEVRAEAKARQENIKAWEKQLGELKVKAQETLEDFQATYGNDLGSLCDPLKAQIERIAALEKDLTDKAGDLNKLLTTTIDPNSIKAIRDIKPQVQYALSDDVTSALEAPIPDLQGPNAYQDLINYFGTLTGAADKALGNGLWSSTTHWDPVQKNRLIRQLDRGQLLNSLRALGGKRIEDIEVSIRESEHAQFLEKFGHKVPQEIEELKKVCTRHESQLTALQAVIQGRTERMKEIELKKRDMSGSTSHLEVEVEKFKKFQQFEELIGQLRSGSVEDAENIQKQLANLYEQLGKDYQDLAPVMNYRLLEAQLDQVDTDSTDELQAQMQELEREHEAKEPVISAMRKPSFFSEQLPAIEEELRISRELDKEMKALMDGDLSDPPESQDDDGDEFNDDRIVRSLRKKAYHALESEAKELAQTLEKNRKDLDQLEETHKKDQVHQLDDLRRQITAIEKAMVDTSLSVKSTIEEIKKSLSQP
jgi:hypothetical protein